MCRAPIDRMKKISALAGLALVLLACSGGGGSGQSSGPPVENGTVTSTSGMEVDATISAATLGDDCGGGARGGFADCSSESGGSCGGGCQASNLQIAFTSSSGSAAAKIEIVSVTLHDAKDDARVDDLEVSSAQKWTSTGYTAWDQTIAPATELKASYHLSSLSLIHI